MDLEELLPKMGVHEGLMKAVFDVFWVLDLSCIETLEAMWDRRVVEVLHSLFD